MTAVMSLERSVSLKSDVSLHEAREMVQNDDAGKWDITVPRDDLSVCDGLLTFGHESGEQQLSATTWATGQLCTRLGIPAPYFRKCPPELQDAQANYWLRKGEHKPGEKWLLRAKDNGANSSTLRAVLSERYSPIDNATLLDELRPLLPDSYRVDWFGLADESLHLRVVDPERYREVLPNDALTVGIHLANSEVGCRSLTVDALVYRLVCTNGLIRLVKGKSLMRQRHLHVSEHRFVGALGEAIECALQESERFLERLKAATQTPIPQIEQVMEKIGEKWHLSEEVQQAARQSLLKEPASQQESLYGLVNAYTAAAQSLPDEMRYDLEVLAGNLAEHGVAAYAPHRKKREVEPTTNSEAQVNNSHHHERVTPDVTTSAEKSIVELAREMFDAEIVGRVPHGRGRKS